MSRLSDALLGNRKPSASVFKAATAWQVGRSFMCGKSECGLLEEELHLSLPDVDMVDIFVSHAWECPGWTKVLALCHFLNLDRATLSAIVTWISAITLVLRAGSLTSPEWTVEYQMYALVLVPMTVFFLVFFLSHGWHMRTSFWLDRLCVDQANPTMKARALDALPSFIASSKEMLVFLNDRYLDRLWCNFELASFHITSDGWSMHIVPLWLPIWMLSSMAMDILGLAFVVLMYELTAPEQPTDGHFVAQDLGPSRWSLFLFMFQTWSAPSVVYSLSAILSFFVHLRRLRQQTLLLVTMENFDIQQAKCKLENDRQIIEQQILELFKDTWQARTQTPDVTPARPTVSVSAGDEKKHIFDEFNKYVRGPMRERLMESIGSEVDIPWKFCVVSYLPFLFSSAAGLVSCNGLLCDDYARLNGYAHFSQYVVCNALGSLTLTLLCLPTLQPIMLRVLKLVTSHVSCVFLQFLLGALCAFATYIFVFSTASAVTSLVIVAFIRFSPQWFVGAVVSYILLLLQTYLLFFHGKVSGFASQRDAKARA